MSTQVLRSVSRSANVHASQMCFTQSTRPHRPREVDARSTMVPGSTGENRCAFAMPMSS